MATAKTAPKPRARKVKAAEFVHNAFAIRTVNPADQAYNGFQWPAEIGALVECPDWNSRASCGNGFHALLDGIGDWSLTWRDDGMIWQVVGVRRDECVAVDSDKVKFPRCRLLYRGDKNGALALILPEMVKAIQGSADAKITSGEKENAAATGDRGHAAATGDRGHAAATGYRGHAAATGYRGIAGSFGPDGTAQAGPTGWLALAHWDTSVWPYELTRVERTRVGENGVEAGKTYRLTAGGMFQEVQ